MPHTYILRYVALFFNTFLTLDSHEKFLKELFDCWYPDARKGKLRYIRYFIGLMNIIAGNHPGSCEMNGVSAVST